MKHTIKIISLAIALSTVSLAAGPVVNRQINQQARIGQGVRSGQLTARETARLECQERQLHTQIVRGRISGGGLSSAERLQIARRQNVLSREIYVQKHDGQYRR